MISVVMPYWNRPSELEEAWRQYFSLYKDLDFEIVVVDDGSVLAASDHVPRDPRIRVVRLPSKSVALNPCVPFNQGVLHARGDIIVLTNPEMRHRTAVLPDLLAAMNSENTYVACACWGVDTKKWHCHSVHKAVHQASAPENAGLHFCAMLHRSLFWRAGGFDERYRRGAGYEDSDFLWRLDRAGALFKILDTAVVEHPKSHTSWSERQSNEEIFYNTWEHLCRSQ